MGIGSSKSEKLPQIWLIRFKFWLQKILYLMSNSTSSFRTLFWKRKRLKNETE